MMGCKNNAVRENTQYFVLYAEFILNFKAFKAHGALVIQVS